MGKVEAAGQQEPSGSQTALRVAAWLFRALGWILYVLVLRILIPILDPVVFALLSPLRWLLGRITTRQAYYLRDLYRDRRKQRWPLLALSWMSKRGASRRIDGLLGN